MRQVYSVTRLAPFRRDRGLCDQIQRAAVSVTSNIAEGHERGTTNDLITFLFYAKGSAGEVRSQLYNAEDIGYLQPAEAKRIRESTRNIGRQLASWIRSMQTTDFNHGPKRHHEPSRADRMWDQMQAEFRANPPWKNRET